MSEDELVDAVVREIQTMAIAGEDVPSLLRRVQKVVGRDDCKLISVVCFHKALDVGIASVSAVAGWHGFGGELSDAQVSGFLLPVLEDYRRTSLE